MILLSESITFLFFLSQNQVIALRNHPLNFLIRHRPVQTDGIPVFLVLMIPGQHSRIGASPKVAPLGVNLHIYPYMPVSFIRPCKRLFIFPAPQKNPVIVMERRVLIYVRKSQAIFQDFFSLFYSNHIHSHMPVSSAIFA